MKSGAAMLALKESSNKSILNSPETNPCSGHLSALTGLRFSFFQIRWFRCYRSSTTGYSLSSLRD